MYETIRNLLQDHTFSESEYFEIPGRPAQYDTIPQFLYDSPIGDYLHQWSLATNAGKPSLWSHQSHALEALGRGDNVVVSTGTASGKSLVFRAFSLHKVLRDPSSKVLVFYPLRALVSDQLRGWREMAKGLGFNEVIVGQIDGSVPRAERDKVLENARIIVMTPDVCQAWLMSRLAMPAIKEFVKALSTLIMDEAHTLEGVFGSNFAFLVRRLIAARNHLIGDKSKAMPLQLVAATATIANPREHMKQLTGSEFTAFGHEVDGAPRYNCIVAHAACLEGDELNVAKDLHQRVLKDGDDGAFITFLDSRKGVETLAMTTQHDLDDILDDPAIASYRGGFTAEDRQCIEKGLRDGAYRGIVSTSALELGIDIPNLRVGFSVGLPPTRKAYRQRLGRVGRNSPGAFVVIGPSNLFQRYGTSLREYHDMSVEPSYLYLDNRFMQFAHGRCLSDERDALLASPRLPARIEWPNHFGDVYEMARPGGSRLPEFDAIAELGGDTPQMKYPLRNVGEINFDIKLHENVDKIGDVTQSQALRECYPGAAYFHMMRSYEVVGWHTATSFSPYIRVKPKSPRRSTRPRMTTWINTSITTTDIIESHLLRSDAGFLAESQMLITERVDGYFDGKTGEFHSYQELQQHNPHMKARSRNFRTSGVVLCIDEDWFKQSDVKSRISDRLREMFTHEHSVLPQDVGSAATNIAVRDSDGSVWRGGCIAIFDQTYGSLRLTEKLYLEFDHILDRLLVAFEADCDNNEFGSIVARMQEKVADFSSQNPFAIDANSILPKGYIQVFAEGSRVFYRSQGFIGTEVEVKQVGIVLEKLMYQVKTPPPGPGQSSVIHWIPADGVEPSGDADAWNYAWWNRETQTYEDPP